MRNTNSGLKGSDKIDSPITFLNFITKIGEKLESIGYFDGFKTDSRAGMRRLVKWLLKEHKHPPDGMEDAVQTVVSQCEMWTDNVMMINSI